MNFQELVYKTLQAQFYNALISSTATAEQIDMTITILTQLLHGRGCDGASGVNTLAAFGIDKMKIPSEKTALYMHVNGRKFAGWLMIEYNEGLDLYDIYTDDVLYISEVYCDELLTVCDKIVEGSDDPEYEDFCESEKEKLPNGVENIYIV